MDIEKIFKKQIEEHKKENIEIKELWFFSENKTKDLGLIVELTNKPPSELNNYEINELLNDSTNYFPFLIKINK